MQVCSIVFPQIIIPYDNNTIKLKKFSDNINYLLNILAKGEKVCTISRQYFIAWIFPNSWETSRWQEIALFPLKTSQNDFVIFCKSVRFKLFFQFKCCKKLSWNFFECSFSYLLMSHSEFFLFVAISTRMFMCSITVRVLLFCQDISPTHQNNYQNLH